MAKIPFRLASIAVVCVTLVGTSTGGGKLLDEPPVWNEKDNNDIPQPKERNPSFAGDVWKEGVRAPLGRLTHPGRNVRRIGSFFGGEEVQQAANVNSLDEVPNSTWFTSRIGLFPMTPEQASHGLGGGRGPDRCGPWTVIAAKTEGVTPGFIIADATGDRFLIKFDPPGFPGTSSAAGVIANRIFHAAGYNVPDDAVVYFNRQDLKLQEGVTITEDRDDGRPMTEKDLDRILSGVSRGADGRWRALSSRFLEGTALGPFSYAGRRKDDPNDRIRHENRRELRGMRILAAWVNHSDTKQHNSLDTYVTENGKRFVRHNLIDFASTLGSSGYLPHPRSGSEYTVDPPAIAGRLFAFGFYESNWRRIERPEGLDELGYFQSEYFDPEEFKPYYSNSAFANMTKRDAYWAAKIISAFTEEHLNAIVAEAKYQNPKAADYVVKILAERRDKIARTYFDRIPPLDFFRRDGDRIVFHDLGNERGIYPGTTPQYRARASAVNADYKVHGWSEWVELRTTDIPLGSGPLASNVEQAPVENYPFAAIEVKVNRGGGWSSTITAYLSRSHEAVVAIHR